MKKILQLMGLGLGVASASFAESGVFHKPYKDAGINHIYNLLFCDDISLFKKEPDEDLSHPWSVLFAPTPDRAELTKVASDQNQEGRVRMLAYNQLRDMNQKVAEKELLGVIIEVGMEEGLDTLAVFCDGGIRYINYTGKMGVVEGGAPKQIEDKAKTILSASQRIVRRRTT